MFSGLFNLRGFDKEVSPLFYSYALVTHTDAKLFLANHTHLLTPQIQSHLNVSANGTCMYDVSTCVSVFEYDDALDSVTSYAQDENVTRILIPSASSFATLMAASVGRYCISLLLQIVFILSQLQRSRIFF